MRVKPSEKKLLIRAAMSILGSRKSAAKTKTCRENAKKPRKRKQK